MSGSSGSSSRSSERTYWPQVVKQSMFSAALVVGPLLGNLAMQVPALQLQSLWRIPTAPVSSHGGSTHDAPSMMLRP